MASDYLSLTNKLLRRLNEVELTETDFLSARGVHGLAKDAILDAINDINHAELMWPFNYVTTSFTTLTPGISLYSSPTIKFLVYDWESFYIENDGVYSTDTHPLPWINQNQWRKGPLAPDYNSGSTGRGIPKYIFPTNVGYGVTPSPDQPYILHYSYWKEPDRLIESSNTTNIPDDWEYVIIFGALYHMNLFKENLSGTQFAEKNYRDALATMRTALINKPENMLDTRVNFGGGSEGYPWTF